MQPTKRRSECKHRKKGKSKGESNKNKKIVRREEKKKREIDVVDRVRTYAGRSH
jgi:hypothetical protein